MRVLSKVGILFPKCLSLGKFKKSFNVVIYIINWMHLDTFDSIWNCFRDSTLLSTSSPCITFNILIAIFLTLYFATYFSWPERLYFQCFFSLKYFDSFDHYAAFWFPLTPDPWGSGWGVPISHVKLKKCPCRMSLLLGKLPLRMSIVTNSPVTCH